ncbi:hypothetical protein, partial [Microcoleus sp. K5-D4]|uniref:hypothetical protein n=1 Tax=Microcoleus sp. K5-D4 TaxID=2818801 RepID=UPI002FD411AE
QLLSTRYAGRNPYTVYLVDLFVTPPEFLHALPSLSLVKPMSNLSNIQPAEGDRGNYWLSQLSLRLCV